MQQTAPSGSGTAIPARFSEQRERVLRIMARWEASVRGVSMAAQVQPQQRCIHLTADSPR